MIAVVGGHGQVGTAAVAQLRAWGMGPLRVGGRGKGHRVDATDPAGLARFCDGARVVLNCAGPSAVIGASVGVAALAAGAAYVDASGDDALHAELARHAGLGAVAVVGAGMMPGLTGLLPKALAEGKAGPAAGGAGPGRRWRPESLVGYVGGRDTITPVAAIDYLAASRPGSGPAYGEAMAAWRDGRRVSGALRTLQNVTVRFFPEPVTLVPYLSTETERLAAWLGVREAEWYSAYAGGRVLAAQYGRGSPAELTRAAELDAFGRRRYQVVAVTVTGGGHSRSAVCAGTGASGLTGAAAALATKAVADGEVPPGVHRLADALDPRAAVRALAGCLEVDACAVVEAATADAEEGAL